MRACVHTNQYGHKICVFVTVYENVGIYRKIIFRLNQSQACLLYLIRVSFSGDLDW
jgi:hypothetical protein